MGMLSFAFAAYNSSLRHRRVSCVSLWAIGRATSEDLKGYRIAFRQDTVFVQGSKTFSIHALATFKHLLQPGSLCSLSSSIIYGHLCLCLLSCSFCNRWSFKMMQFMQVCQRAFGAFASWRPHSQNASAPPVGQELQMQTKWAPHPILCPYPALPSAKAASAALPTSVDEFPAIFSLHGAGKSANQHNYWVPCFWNTQQARVTCFNLPKSWPVSSILWYCFSWRWAHKLIFSWGWFRWFRGKLKETCSAFYPQKKAGFW